LPNEFVVSEYDVFKELLKSQRRKSIRPDAVPQKIPKDLADTLAAPDAAITDASIRQGAVPEFWTV
jgi:hypothetical protein